MLLALLVRKPDVPKWQTVQVPHEDLSADGSDRRDCRSFPAQGAGPSSEQDGLIASVAVREVDAFVGRGCPRPGQTLGAQASGDALISSPTERERGAFAQHCFRFARRVAGRVGENETWQQLQRRAASLHCLDQDSDRCFAGLGMHRQNA